VALRRLAILAIVAVCLGGPIVELFDQWDHTVQDGNDTESNAVIVAICVGVALSIAGVVVARIRAFSSVLRRCLPVSLPIRFDVATFDTPSPTVSPPTPLRV
jgi:hypothetical protein